MNERSRRVHCAQLCATLQLASLTLFARRGNHALLRTECAGARRCSVKPSDDEHALHRQRLYGSW